jgi:hypothetical protein
MELSLSREGGFVSLPPSPSPPAALPSSFVVYASGIHPTWGREGKGGARYRRGQPAEHGSARASARAPL